MKKSFTLGVFIFAAIIYYACNKETGPSPDQQMITKAKNYFISVQSKTAAFKFDSTEPTRLNTGKKPLWSQATILTLDSFKKIVVVPLQYDREIYIRSNLDKTKMFDINKIAKLIIYQDAKAIYHAEVITILPDSIVKDSRSFSGNVLSEEWNGNFLREFNFAQNGIRRVTKINPTESANLVNQPSTLTVCYYMEGYNYAVNDPANGYSYSETLGCTTYTFDNGSNDNGLSGNNYASIAGGSGTSSSAAPTITEFKGDKPISVIANFIKCFQINASSTYSVTLYVDQPVDGSRTSYSSSGSSSLGLSIGHAFLAFTQNQGGVITRRSLGLYPSGSVTPFTPSSKGSLNDDAGHIFDVSLTISLSPTQFNSILTTCANGNNTKYNLNTNNCVSWALSSLAAGGINIQTTPGTWPFGGGDDPGDLGQDLRNMTLSPNMTRSTIKGFGLSNLNFCN